MRTRRGIVAAIVAAVALTACADTDQPAAETEATDPLTSPSRTTTTDTGRRSLPRRRWTAMKNITWQKPAITPDFGMPICAPTSHVAGVRDAAVRVTGLAVYRTGGSDAWSPPIS